MLRLVLAAVAGGCAVGAAEWWWRWAHRYRPVPPERWDKHPAM